MPVDDEETGEKQDTQRDILVDRHRLQYEGLFVVQDFYKLIDEYFEEKGYDKREFKNVEVVRDDGIRYLEIIFRPWKKITDYARVVQELRLIMENVKEVEVEKDGVKTYAHQGKVLCTFNVFLDTDYEDKWGRKPPFWVVRILFDRYFFKSYTKQYYAEALDDYRMLVYQIKAYLNMSKE